MIKNKKQYQVTKKRIEKLKSALDAAHETKIEMPQEIFLAMIAGVESQIQDMELEISEYEMLSDVNSLQINEIEELGKLLIKARIAKGLNQKEYAERCGLKPQQIQNYEASNYASASLQKIYELYKALDVKFSAFLDLYGNTNRDCIGYLMHKSIDKITSEEGIVSVQETGEDRSLIAYAPKDPPYCFPKIPAA